MAVLIPSSTLTAQNSKQWSLDDCLHHAMTNNISLKKRAIAWMSASEDVKQAKAALLPSLSASTSRSVGYRPWVNSGVSTVANGTVATSVNKSYYNGSYGLNASWVLWNGKQNVNTVKLNKLMEQQAELDSAVAANSIKEQITQLYMQILYLDEAVAVTKQSLKTSELNEQRGKEMMEVGKLSKADWAQLAAQTATDRYNVVEAESSLANMLLQLKQLLEITGEEDFAVTVPSTGDSEVTQAVPSLQSTYDEALLHRPEMEQQRLSISENSLNISIVRAGYLPTLSLNGGASTSTSSMSDKNWGKQMKTNFDVMGGLSLSIPLFDQRKTKTAVRKAQLQKMESELSLLEQQKSLYSTIEGLWLDATTNQQKYLAAKVGVESEEASFELLSEQFRLGLKNTIELMNGKNALLQAQQNMLQSKYLTLLNLKLLTFYAKGEL